MTEENTVKYKSKKIKDFLSKIYITLKECIETLYWLELLFETEYLSESEYKSLPSDGDEIRNNGNDY